jgi:hypothetical protein
MAIYPTSTIDDQPAAAGVGTDTSALSGLATFGLVLGVAGALSQTIGAYYSTVSQRYQLRSQALDLELAGSIADLNARAAEQDAAAIARAGQQQKGLATLRYGQAKAESRTRTAAAGLQAGVGSAAEVQASIELAKELDAFVIEENALRAAGNARRRAVDERNRALLARTQASSLRRIGKSLSPTLSSISSLIGGAGQVSQALLFQEALSSR